MAAKSSNPTVVLVTGANQGIGFEIAKKLGVEHKDYHIIVSGRRKDAVEEAADKLQRLGSSVEPLVLDVKSDESIAAAVNTVEAKHGYLDVLINNAGISGGTQPENRALYNEIFDTNVSGTAVVTDAFIPLLERSKNGPKRIVFMGSTVASLTYKAARHHPFRKVPWRFYTISRTAGHMLALYYVVRFEGDPSWKINICSPPNCSTNLNGFHGTAPVEEGAINAARLATLGFDGETGTFTETEGPIAW